MHDTFDSDVPRDVFVSEYDDPSLETLHRPETPLPDDSHALRRTASYASIQTVHPRANKGIRRRIIDIAEGLKHKSVRSKKGGPSAQGVPKPVASERACSKNVPASKAPKNELKVTVPLEKSLRRFEGGSFLAIHDRFYNGILSARDMPLTSLLWKSDAQLDKTLSPEDEPLGEDSGPAKLSFERGAYAHTESEEMLLPLKADIRDFQLEIWPSESDVTIWDGLQASQHVFKCRLYLRCMTHPYGGVDVPDVRRIDMSCHTNPAGSRYAQPPALQATYEGGSRSKKKDGSPKVDLETGIQINKSWHTVSDDEGTWGWCKKVFVPLSPRLFDKMEYREFKLVSQVWMGESCLEGDLTFGISMLLRGVDME